MAESPSSALLDGIEWLSTLGGARLLRIPAGVGRPGSAPALILRSAEGEEHHIEPGPEARFSNHIGYLVPAGLPCSSALLQWPDGTRAPVPSPPPRAEVIQLRTRRVAPAAAPREVAPPPARGLAGRPGERAPTPEAPSPRDAPRPPRRELVAARAWTAPPPRAGAGELELALERARTLQADLRAARAARAADASLLATLAGELEAERSAHAVTRGSLATLSDALAAARAELALARDAAETARQIGADARAHLTSARRDAALARAEVATLRADLETERAARARAEAALAEAGSPFLRRVAELDRDLAGLRDQVRLERRAREQAEAAAAAARPPLERTGRLVADLDAAAAALRAATSAPPASPPASAASPTSAAAPPAVAAPPETASPPAVAASPAPAVAGSRHSLPARSRVPVRGTRDRLRQALVALADDDPVVAGTLLAGLLPAQGVVLDEALSYDLTLRGVGTFAVLVGEGSARVQRLPRPRPRREAAFHLAGEPLALAQLLAGEQRKVRRFGRSVKVSGRRKRLRALRALPASRLSLADAVRAGARLEPWLVYRALPYAIPAEWTRGHVFTVAQEIVELAPRAWYITARDGVRLTVAEHVSGGPADATVTMNRATFDRLLRGDPVAGGELPVVRGDRAAVAALKRWTDLARCA